MLRPSFLHSRPIEETLTNDRQALSSTERLGLLCQLILVPRSMFDEVRSIEPAGNRLNSFRLKACDAVLYQP